MKAMLTVLILGPLAAAPAFADCAPPDNTVQIPDGNSASRDQMIAAQKSIKAYDAAVKTYADCLQQDEDAKVAAGADRAAIHPANAKLNNAEVDKVQALADRFNTELHAYKAKNPG